MRADAIHMTNDQEREGPPQLEILEFILIVIAIVLVSAVLGESIPKVSVPLVQIALGLALVLIIPSLEVPNVSSELFLVLFIAPLLFDESRQISTASVWNNFGDIMSLAVGLVLVSLLVVGFVLHWIEPSIPLAAAFALGAALGPTDAVAVSSLSDEVHLNDRQHTLLSGEALLNDASGVVSFQFAIAAAVTGAFSLVDATYTFFVTFIGGIALGIALAIVLKLLVTAVRARGLESTTVHVLMEVFTPFFIYIAAERLGVSGILAVVAAGLFLTVFPERTNPSAARSNVVSSSVWEVLVFCINGFIFVMLGMRLPAAFAPATEEGDLGIAALFLCIFVVTALIIGIRFVWILAMEAVNTHTQTGRSVRLEHALAKQGLTSASPDKHAMAHHLIRRGDIAPTATPFKDALVTTLAGSKGAVTLSIVFTIPLVTSTGAAFPHRDALIFIASGVIILTLLLANFVVPALSPSTATDGDEPSNVMRIAVYKQVIKALQANETSENRLATHAVVRSYRDRIAHFRAKDASSKRLTEVRGEVLDRQMQVITDLMERGLTTKVAGAHYLKRLKQSKRMLARGHSRAQVARSPWRYPVTSFGNALRSVFNRRSRKQDPELDRELRKLSVQVEQAAIVFLDDKYAHGDKETRRVAKLLVEEHESLLSTAEARANDRDGTMTIMQEGINPHVHIRTEKEYNQLVTHLPEVEANGLRLELNIIQEMRESGAISRSVAQDLREEVYVMQMDLD